MIPASYDFRVRRGDSETLAVIVKLDDVRSSRREEADFSGVVVSWKIGIFTRTSSSGGGLTVEGGLVSVALDRFATASLPDSCPYALFVDFPSGERETYLTGYLLADTPVLAVVPSVDPDALTPAAVAAVLNLLPKDPPPGSPGQPWDNNGSLSWT